MLRYENAANATINIAIPHTDYTVKMEALWNKESKHYICTTYLSRNDIESYNLINENIVIESSIKDIKRKMAENITEKFNKDGFKKEIDSYEYADKCFNTGIEVLESK